MAVKKVEPGWKKIVYPVVAAITGTLLISIAGLLWRLTDANSRREEGDKALMREMQRINANIEAMKNDDKQQHEDIRNLNERTIRIEEQIKKEK